jgi:hypothetical protein
MEVDMRSNDKAALAKLEAQVIALVNEAVAQENKRWDGDSLKVEIKLVGDRPAGTQAADSPVPQAAAAAVMAVGIPRFITEASSTDSNLAISLGVPAVTMRAGGRSGGTHSLGRVVPAATRLPRAAGGLPDRRGLGRHRGYKRTAAAEARAVDTGVRLGRALERITDTSFAWLVSPSDDPGSSRRVE